MYFDRHIYSPIFNTYRSVYEQRCLLLARQEQLKSNAQERLRRRLRATGNKSDTNLERVEHELQQLEPQYRRLREEVATAAYLVATNYSTKFFRRDNQLCSADERDDAVQAAVLKIVLVAHRYDEQRGTLHNFLSKVCLREFISHIRRVQQQTINHIRHVESFHGQPPELVPESEDETLIVIAPEWQSVRPVTAFASYGSGDDVASITFTNRKKKLRKSELPSLARIVAARAG